MRMSFPWLPAVKAYYLNASILLDQYMELKVALAVDAWELQHCLTLVVGIVLHG